MVSRKLKKYIFLTVLFDSAMLLYTFIPSAIVIALQICWILFSLLKFSQAYGMFEALLYTSITLIPISFISITGVSVSAFPVAWFHVIVIVLTAYALSRGKVKVGYFYGICGLGLVGVFSSIVQPDIGDAMAQVLMIVLFMFSFVIGDFAYHFTSKQCYLNVLYIYVASVVAMSIQVIVQKWLYTNMGIVVGSVARMAGRTAFAGLLGDYSFATLYIASGIMAVIILYFIYNKMGIMMFGGLSVTMALGMITVTSRTGLFALAITMVLFYVSHVRKMNWKYILVLLVAMCITPSALETLIEKRGGQNLLDSSGRISTYISALNVFLHNPLLGIGFGLSNLKLKTGLQAPHNFFIQYLAQTGTIGIAFILMPFFCYFHKVWKMSDASKWLLVLIFIGAMFIPDITSSRFLYAVIVMVNLSCGYRKREGERGES